MKSCLTAAAAAAGEILPSASFGFCALSRDIMFLDGGRANTWQIAGFQWWLLLDGVVWQGGRERWRRE